MMMILRAVSVLSGSTQPVNPEVCIENLRNHLWLAKEVERTYKYLMKERYIPWTIVTAFYAAVNYIDAYLWSKGIETSRHVKRRDKEGHDNARNEFVKEYLPEIKDDFFKLYQYSIAARYTPKSAKKYNAKRLEIVDTAFQVVKNEIKSNIKSLGIYGTG